MGKYLNNKEPPSVKLKPCHALNNITVSKNNQTQFKLARKDKYKIKNKILENTIPNISLT